MTERNNVKKDLSGREKENHQVDNRGKGTKKRKGGVRLNLMQCGDGPDHGREEAGAAAAAAADILLSR